MNNIYPWAPEGKSVQHSVYKLEKIYSTIYHKRLQAVNQLRSTTDQDLCTLHHGKFSELPKIIQENKTDLSPWVQKCTGILLDFGVSELQLNSGKGFNPDLNEPLDLRMDETGTTAAEVLDHMEMDDLMRVFKVYGGVVCSRAIVTDIIERRYLLNSLKTSKELRNLALSVLHQSEHFQVVTHWL